MPFRSKVETFIFLTTGRDFTTNGRDFIMNGSAFQDDRSGF